MIDIEDQAISESEHILLRLGSESKVMIEETKMNGPTMKSEWE